MELLITGISIGTIIVLIIAITRISYKYGALSKEVELIHKNVSQKLDVDIFDREIINIKEKIDTIYNSNTREHKAINDKLDSLIDKLSENK